MKNPKARVEQDTARSGARRERVAGSGGYVDGRVTHLVDLAGTGGRPAPPEPRPAVSAPEEPAGDLPNTDISPTS